MWKGRFLDYFEEDRDRKSPFEFEKFAYCLIYFGKRTEKGPNIETALLALLFPYEWNKKN